MQVVIATAYEWEELVEPVLRAVMPEAFADDYQGTIKFDDSGTRRSVKLASVAGILLNVGPTPSKKKRIPMKKRRRWFW